VLTLAEGAGRVLDQIVVSAVGALQRRGTFAARGYENSVLALCDLLGLDRVEARPRVAAAEAVCERVGLDGQVLPAKLPATAAVFAAGRAGLRHVEVIAGAFHGELGEVGGHRPHLNVLIPLDDLEHRARAAVLDFGGRLDPASLRQPACDARVIPVVLDGAGQPLDVGRGQRTVPDGLRRAVAARDRGCAHPGCGRTASWCHIHHIQEWEHLGETKLGNLVALCRFHHRLLHRESGWTVRIRDGIPEFIPPAWIDKARQPRRKPLPHLTAGA
jgi:hypothetical protein